MQPETVDNLITNFEQSVVLREEELGTATVQSESSSSAKLKRRSFAKKKPLARVTLIKTSSFDGGSFHTAKTINRRAAVRKMGNPSTMAGMTNMAKGHNFAERNSEVPGTFSPRTSLRRQKSISAESLAGIRSSSESDRRVTEDRVNRTQATGEIVPDHMTKDDKCKDIDDRNRQTSTHMTYEGIVLPRRSKCLGSISDIDYGEENEVFVLDKTEEKSDTSCRGQIDTQGEGMADEEQADGLLQKVSSLDEDQKTQDAKSPKAATRTVSDSVVISQRSGQPRWVTFASQSSNRSAMRKLQRTPTPYWPSSEDHSEDEYTDHGEEDQVKQEAEYNECPEVSK